MRDMEIKEVLKRWWAELNYGKIPDEIKRCDLSFRTSKEEAYAFGMFDLLSSILSEKDQEEAWKEYVRVLRLKGERKMITLKEALEIYDEHVVEAQKWGKIVVKMLQELLRTVIPDIEITLGWEEAGIEAVVIWSSSISNGREVSLEEEIPIDKILKEYFEPKGFYFDEMDVWLTEEEAQQVREKLEEALSEKNEV